VLVEECLCLDQVRRLEHARLGLGEKSAAHAIADVVAHGIAHYCGQEADKAEQEYVQVSLRGQEPGSKEEAIARQEDAEEQAGLGKDHSGHAEVRDRLDEALQIKMWHSDWFLARGN
jgi:hypothetical protein